MTVYLVGAGPGDPGLMTVRALELIAAADVIIYDRLIPDTALDGARPGAQLIYAGKEGGGPSMPQAEIEHLLVTHGSTAGTVVRLKGGDPFVFGRGAEEREVLDAAGVPFQVIPGVTSAIAAPAAAGIPVTHRRLASAFAVVTGHECKGLSDLDWEALARIPTLVVLMGLRALPEIAARLLAQGTRPETPAAVIASATLLNQRTVIGTLATIAERAGAAGLEPPATLVVGEVVRLAAIREPHAEDLALTGF
jgi:uroporphyrin-III C-methyltransferase